MKTTDQITTIAAALLKAQSAMTFAIKSAKNPHFKSNYADLPAVIEAIKPALNANGIVFVQGIAGDSAGVIVTTRLLHTSGEWIEDSLFIPCPQATAQAYGSAITYGRRYGLQSIVGLPADDDDGNEASKPSEAPRGSAKAAAVEARKELSEEQQEVVGRIADETLRRFEDGSELYWWLENKRLSSEEYLGLWSLLPSDVRSLIKKQKAEERKAA